MLRPACVEEGRHHPGHHDVLLVVSFRVAVRVVDRPRGGRITCLGKMHFALQLTALSRLEGAVGRSRARGAYHSEDRMASGRWSANDGEAVADAREPGLHAGLKGMDADDSIIKRHTTLTC